MANVINNKDRLAIFEKELGFYHSNNIREFAKLLVAELPNYFFFVASSATGKYHPEYANGEGGLVRHTQAGMRIAKSLFTISDFTIEEEDLILLALQFHDSIKRGRGIDSGHTVYLHPIYASRFIRQYYYDHIEITKTLISGVDLEIVCRAIESHMGQWNTDGEKYPILPVPVTPLQKFVHECDYLASRKMLEVNFNVGV